MDDIIAVAGRERIDAEEVILYPEGIFYRAYGYSALRFIRALRPYQAKKRYYKKLGGEVCYIGFPQSALEGMLKGEFRAEETDGMYVIRGPFGEIAPEEYDAWVRSIPLSVTKPRAPATAAKTPSPEATGAEHPANAAGSPNYEHTDAAAPAGGESGDISAEEEVLHRLHAFALETATPLECMLFLSDLKRRLNG